MLKLRDATFEDFSFYYNLKCEDSSIYWSGYSQKPDFHKLFDFWNMIIKEKCDRRHIYILSENNIPVGYVQTIDAGTDIGLSMGIVESARGHGFGKEIIRLAINERGNNNQYYCFIREDNVVSQKCFVSNCFTKTDEYYDQFFELDQKNFKMFKYIRKKERILAIIPARSGSKGLKDKNIKELNGKPLLTYSLGAAFDSELFDTVHVSTDSQVYAEMAKSFGADQPFLRDQQNAEDFSSSWDVVREVLMKYKAMGKEFDVCVLLQPTSPMRTADDITSAYKLFEKRGAKSLTSVTEVDHPVQWCFKLDESCSMKDFASSPFKDCRRQELEKHYRENGAIYIVRTEDIVNPSFDFYSDQCVAYVMDRGCSIDIDTLQDFVIAETIMRIQSEERK